MKLLAISELQKFLVFLLGKSMSRAAEDALTASKRRFFPWFADDEHCDRVSSPNSQINYAVGQFIFGGNLR